MESHDIGRRGIKGVQYLFPMVFVPLRYYN